jgi:hypothetical protein
MMACVTFLWSTMCENSFSCTLFGIDINCYLLGAFNWGLALIMLFIIYKLIKRFANTGNHDGGEE